MPVGRVVTTGDRVRAVAATVLGNACAKERFPNDWRSHEVFGAVTGARTTSLWLLSLVALRSTCRPQLGDAEPVVAQPATQTEPAQPQPQRDAAGVLRARGPAPAGSEVL